MVFQQKNAHQNFAINRSFYTNWAPLTVNFYRHNTLDFSRRAAVIERPRCSFVKFRVPATKVGRFNKTLIITPLTERVDCRTLRKLRFFTREAVELDHENAAARRPDGVHFFLFCRRLKKEFGIKNRKNERIA